MLTSVAQLGREPLRRVNSRELGWEFDAILGYDYSKDVRVQLVYGVFLPAHAYQLAGFSVAAQEVRAEVNVKF